jgi:hypothetical protein
MFHSAASAFSSRPTQNLVLKSRSLGSKSKLSSVHVLRVVMGKRQTSRRPKDLPRPHRSAPAKDRLPAQQFTQFLAVLYIPLQLKQARSQATEECIVSYPDELEERAQERQNAAARAAAAATR